MDRLVWTPVKIKLGAIRPWSDNPRYSTKAQAERLIESEKQLGQPQTLAVSPFDESGMADLYDGHQRYMAWMTVKGGDFEVWALQSNRYLTDEERRKAVILLHAGAVGSWNWDELSNWDTNLLKQVGMDEELLKNLQSDTRALAEMLESERFVSGNSDAEPEIDRANELLEKWQVEAGDLWQIGEHRLICGDCTDAAVVERLMGGERAQMCFTSPPYNAGNNWSDFLGSADKKMYSHYDDDMTAEDYRRFILSALKRCSDNAKNRDGYGKILFSNENPFSVKETIIWDKHSAINLMAIGIYSRRCEFIFVMSLGDKYLTTQKNGESRWNYWETKRPRQTDGHRATFPIELAERAITELSFPKSIVYEPFAGTGTTIVACQNLGRKCRAVEISPAYCAIILERMATAFPGIEIKRLTQSD